MDFHHNLLVCFAVALVTLSCAFGAERPQIYREDNGDLHINPGENQTVYIGDVDILAEIADQKAEIAHLKAELASLEGENGVPSKGCTVVPVVSGNSGGFVTNDVFVESGFSDPDASNSPMGFTFFFAWNVTTPRFVRVPSPCFNLQAIGAGLVVSKRSYEPAGDIQLSICYANGLLRVALTRSTRKIDALALTPDGSKLITQHQNRDENLEVYDTLTGVRVMSIPQSNFGVFALMPDNLHLYVYTEVLASTPSGIATRVRKFSFSSTSPLNTFELDYSFFSKISPLRALPVSPNGKYIGIHAVKEDDTLDVDNEIPLYSAFLMEDDLVLGAHGSQLFRLPDQLPWLAFEVGGTPRFSPDGTLAFFTFAGAGRLCVI